MYWTSSSGGIELNITRKQAEACAHPGPCDSDVLELSGVPAINRQLAKIDPASLREELREYAAWDDIELSDHDANLQRLLWLACGDIVDGNV